MSGAATIVKLHLKGRYTWWFFIPWAVVVSSFAVNLVIGILAGGGAEIQSGGLSAFFGMMFVAGVVAVKGMFPFALGMSRRRTDFFVGTMATTLLAGAVAAVALWLLRLLERATGYWGMNLHFFSLSFMDHFTPVALLAVLFILPVHTCLLGLFAASVHCRFGSTGVVALAVAVLAVATGGSALATLYGWWQPIALWLSRHYLELFWWMVPASVLYALASYFLLRKATA